MKNVLVTGGAGFIGSNFINHLLGKRDNLKIVNLDSLTYAGNLENLLHSEEHPNYTFAKEDITDRDTAATIFEKHKIDNVIHEAIKKTIDWYVNNEEWWERIISGEYQDYYKKQYNH